MQTLHLEDGRTALVIVAHPDDETIWLGGTIMKHPQISWSVFSLCRASDADRAPKFNQVCQNFLQAEPIITDLDDEDKLSVAETVPLIKQLIKEKIGNRHFDYLFTHGANGEYGHPRHIGLHLAIQAMIKANSLHFTTGFYFAYQKETNINNEENNKLIPNQPDYILELSDSELKLKKQIVAEQYGYAGDGIDVNYCTNPESFKLIQKNTNQ
ncbi:MAG: PIG-L family deacetylase [bacterium]